MSSDRPQLQVVSGNPNAEELAALVVVLSAVGTNADSTTSHQPTGQWANPARGHRSAVHPGGSGNWWASGLPK